MLSAESYLDQVPCINLPQRSLLTAIGAQCHNIWCPSSFVAGTSNNRPQLDLRHCRHLVEPRTVPRHQSANLALSRSIWLFLRYGKRHDDSQTRSTSSKTPRSGHSYGQSTPQLRPDGFESPRVVIACRGGRQLDSRRSEGSDVPLEPGIQKKMEFWLVENSSDGDVSLESINHKLESGRDMTSDGPKTLSQFQQRQVSFLQELVTTSLCPRSSVTTYFGTTSLLLFPG